MHRTAWLRASVAAALVATLCGVAAASSTARPKPPGLKLITVARHIDVIRFPHSPYTYFQPGIYVAASGGAWEVDVYRRPGGPRAWQVTRSDGAAHRVRLIRTVGRLRMRSGLPNFFSIALISSGGAEVASGHEPFCPAGYLMARVSPTGPENPTYPEQCGSKLTRVGLWGINNGWGQEISFPLRTGAIRDGRYVLNVEIARRYAREFGIPPDQRSATVQVRIRSAKIPPKLGAAVATSRHPSSRAARPSAVVGNNPLGGPGGVPNLRALPAHDLRITHYRRSGRDYLGFGATIWNAGSGPMVLEGFRHNAAPTMPATQFILRNGRVVARHRAGRFEFDTRRGHDHWHMEQIARYELLSADGSTVIRSHKQSFCLAPTDPVNLTLPGSDWQPDESALWSACEGQDAIWIREVLPAGWGDTYFQEVAGQSFNITDLPNGSYRIRITADPPHALEETSYRDNVSNLRITLGGTPGHRTVRIP